MKRWMLFLLAALVLAILSPACAPIEEPPEVKVETPAPEVVTEVEQVTMEPAQETILFMTWASTAFEQDAVEKMVEQFEEDNPQITVDRIVVR